MSRSVSRITRDGRRTVLTDSFGGKKYNQPNDLTIDSKNRIYFSDPRYGSREDMQQKDADARSRVRASHPELAPLGRSLNCMTHGIVERECYSRRESDPRWVTPGRWPLRDR